MEQKVDHFLANLSCYEAENLVVAQTRLKQASVTNITQRALYVVLLERQNLLTELEGHSFQYFVHAFNSQKYFSLLQENGKILQWVAE